MTLLGLCVGAGTDGRSRQNRPKPEEHARKGNGSMVAYFKYHAAQLEDDQQYTSSPVTIRMNKGAIHIFVLLYFLIYDTGSLQFRGICFYLSRRGRQVVVLLVFHFTLFVLYGFDSVQVLSIRIRIYFPSVYLRDY